MPFVLDASAALSFCFEDEVAAIADEALRQLQSGDVAYVPALFYWEFLNGILTAKRRGRVDGRGQRSCSPSSTYSISKLIRIH